MSILIVVVSFFKTVYFRNREDIIHIYKTNKRRLLDPGTVGNELLDDDICTLPNNFFFFTFPPFVCAQIRKCTAQGKVTEKARKIRETNTIKGTIIFYKWTSTK